MTQVERKKEWEARIAAYKSSGQGPKEWCEAHNVKAHQLWYWLRKFESTEATVTLSSKWLPLEVKEQTDTSENPLLIRIGHVVVEVKPGFDPTLLSDVVRTLSSTLC